MTPAAGMCAQPLGTLHSGCIAGGHEPPQPARAVAPADAGSEQRAEMFNGRMLGHRESCKSHECGVRGFGCNATNGTASPLGDGTSA